MVKRSKMRRAGFEPLGNLEVICYEMGYHEDTHELANFAIAHLNPSRST
jgi:hypothetical protein